MGRNEQLKCYYAEDILVWFTKIIIAAHAT